MTIKRIFKVLAWTLIGLLGLALLVALSWWLTNRVDADPKPWPAALQMAPNRLADGDNLYIALHAAPAAAFKGSLQDCGPKGDCNAAWRERLPEWTKQREQSQAFGQACEAAVRREPLRFEEPLPEQMRPETPLPEYQRLTHCALWLHTLVLQAAQEGRKDEAVQRLNDIDRLDRAVQQGSRMLVGQMISVSMQRSQLLLLRGLAQQQPTWAAELARFAQTAPQSWREGTQRWIAGEASFQRGIADSLAKDPCTAMPGRDPDVWDRMGCAWQASTAQPEYLKQLMAADWSKVLDQVAKHEMEALPAAVQSSLDGDFRGWTWNHTLPHIVRDVARPAFGAYFERVADALLSSQATALWLQAHALPAAERAAWLKQQAKGELAQRLTIADDGEWVLQLWNSKGSKGMPDRWPAIRS